MSQTYRDCVVLAGVCSELTEHKAFIFEQPSGAFRVYLADCLADAAKQAEAEAPGSQLVETIKRHRRPASPQIIDLG